MKTSLSKNKLVEIKKTTLQTVVSPASSNVAVTQHNNRLVGLAMLEAEHKKAQAITILRRYNFR